MSTILPPQRVEPAPGLRTELTTLRKRITADESGATAIEYALIAAGIGAAVAGTVWSLGSSTASLYQSLAAMF